MALLHGGSKEHGHGATTSALYGHGGGAPRMRGPRALPNAANEVVAGRVPWSSALLQELR
jgi:hypothetical protein